MKNELYKHIKFRIGEESYFNEFKLITKDEYCCKKYCYDVYEFEKEKDEYLFDLKIEKIEVFTCKKGDMLIWHANILHGGEPHIDKNKTRKSMVFHYFDQKSIYYHEVTQRPALFPM